MRNWLLGDMRLPEWQRRMVDDVVQGKSIQMLVNPRPSRRQRVIGDAYLVIAATLNDKKVVFTGPDDTYEAEVQAEVERILERFGDE